MNINQLITFVEVVNQKSFSKAAEKLFITQPAVTSHVKSLEDELCITLIDRSNKKIAVTEPGKILFEHAVNMINTINIAKHQINIYENDISGNLNIFSSSIPAQYILPSILKNFVDKYNNVTFTIHKRNSKEVIETVLKGQANYGIVGSKYKYENLDYFDFFEDELVLATSAIKRNNCNIISKSDLINEKLIFREKGSSSRLLVENALQLNNIDQNRLNIISHVEDNETIKQLVELGVGSSFISKIAIKKEIALGLIKPVLVSNFSLKRKFYFVYHKNRYLSPIEQAFKDFICK